MLFRTQFSYLLNSLIEILLSHFTSKLSWGPYGPQPRKSLVLAGGRMRVKADRVCNSIDFRKTLRDIVACLHNDLHFAKWSSTKRTRFKICCFYEEKYSRSI